MVALPGDPQRRPGSALGRPPPTPPLRTARRRSTARQRNRGAHDERAEPKRTGRIVLGRHGRSLVASRPRESVVVFGPPGAGKTSAFAIPNVLEWDGPVVVCSVTSEILSTTLSGPSQPRPNGLGVRPGRQRRRGHPDRMEPDPTMRRLPKSHPPRTPPRVAVRPDGVTQGDFWQSAASDLLGPLLHAAAIGHRSVTDVMAWLVRPPILPSRRTRRRRNRRVRNPTRHYSTGRTPTTPRSPP